MSPNSTKDLLIFDLPVVKTHIQMGVKLKIVLLKNVEPYNNVQDKSLFFSLFFGLSCLA